MTLGYNICLQKYTDNKMTIQSTTDLRNRKKPDKTT